MGNTIYHKWRDELFLVGTWNTLHIFLSIDRKISDEIYTLRWSGGKKRSDIRIQEKFTVSFFILLFNKHCENNKCDEEKNIVSKLHPLVLLIVFQSSLNE